MKNKSKLALSVSLVLVVLIGIVYFVKSKSSSTQPEPSTSPTTSLPINTIPVSERPFLSLTPNSTGRRLTLTLDHTQVKDIIEYELIYQATGKQEGVFGRLNLNTESLPIEKDLLLGSQSAGGKITYHEGVTGGSVTLTYGDVKLKERFNFLRFDSQDTTYSSPDARFEVTFNPKAMVKDKVILTMKTFGLPIDLPKSAKLIAGPYAFFTPSFKGEIKLSLHLPAGEHQGLALLTYDSKAQQWLELPSELVDDSLTATTEIGNIFIVISQ